MKGSQRVCLAIQKKLIILKSLKFFRKRQSLLFFTVTFKWSKTIIFSINTKKILFCIFHIEHCTEKLDSMKAINQHNPWQCSLNEVGKFSLHVQFSNKGLSKDLYSNVKLFLVGGHTWKRLNINFKNYL